MTEGVTIQLNEALSIFKENLEEVKEQLSADILTELEALPEIVQDENENLMWVRNEMRALEIEKIRTERTLTINRIVSYLQNVVIDPPTPLKKASKITEEDIARAREMPIEEMYSGRLFKSGGKSQCGLCPFHNERTPSFHIYKDNRYKCFGCQEHGDAIEFYMKQNGLKFIDAVKRMTGK